MNNFLDFYLTKGENYINYGISKGECTVNQVSCKGDKQVLVDEDIIVPDVKPDILKILQLDAVSCITNKEITNGRVNVTGRVDLKILYIPDSDRVV